MAVGQRVERLDAREKATGRALYVDDLQFPRMLHGKLVRSPYPSARIVRVETRRATALVGVKAVLTAADLPEGRTGPFIKDEPALARGRVRFIGEPVAAVAATDPEIAEEAVRLIEVEYEELPAVFDVEAAMRPDAPLVHASEEFAAYVKVWPAVSQGNVCSTTVFEEGDLEAGFRQADVVVEDVFRTQMQLQAYMEPSGSIAVPDASGRVTVYASTQAPHLNQSRISELFGIPMSQIRVVATRVGGGFGGKVELLAQPIVVALARSANRPVKMIFTREEEFIAARPRHAAMIAVKIGAKKDGTITAKSVRLLFDSGAYADDGPGIAGFGGMMARGPYRVPNLRIESHCVYTNKVKTGAFRGFGNPQATFASESMMDVLAEALGVDPVEFRLKNGVEPGDFAVGGQVMRSVEFKTCLRKAAEAIRWGEKPGPRRGKGVAGINHISGLLSSGASVKMNEDGTFALMVGAVDIGQGSDTVLVQILAEELGVRADQISVISGDTDATPYNWAVAASRTTFTAGNAVRKAGAEVKRQILALAADLLEANPVDLEAGGGFVTVKGVPGRRVSYRELGLASHWVRRGPILGSASYMVEGPAYDPKRTIMTGFPFGPLTAYIFGAQAVEVEVDTDTGQVTIVDAVGAHDVGRAINPTLVEGQIQGGFMQGVGYALMEALHLDGGRVTNPSFADYRLPSALDAPPARPIIVEGGDETGPFGAKGVGEPAIVGPAPAIANAIYRAVGVRIRELPITPERVLRALQARAETGPSGARGRERP